jgi:hypothetical protein
MIDMQRNNFGFQTFFEHFGEETGTVQGPVGQENIIDFDVFGGDAKVELVGVDEELG